MLKSLAVVALMTLGICAFAQQDLNKLIIGRHDPVRIPIYHADPWMVKMMLEGTPVTQPEYSTIQGAQGSMGGQGGLGQGSNSGRGGGSGMSGRGMGTQGSGNQSMGRGNQSMGSQGGGNRGMGQGSLGMGNRGMGQGNSNRGSQGNRGGGGKSNSLVPDGWTLMVNPTDNSLWLIPDHTK